MKKSASTEINRLTSDSSNLEREILSINGRTAEGAEQVWSLFEKLSMGGKLKHLLQCNLWMDRYRVALYLSAKSFPDIAKQHLDKLLLVNSDGDWRRFIIPNSSLSWNEFIFEKHCEQTLIPLLFPYFLPKYISDLTQGRHKKITNKSQFHTVKSTLGGRKAIANVAFQRWVDIDLIGTSNHLISFLHDEFWIFIGNNPLISENMKIHGIDVSPSVQKSKLKKLHFVQKTTHNSTAL